MSTIAVNAITDASGGNTASINGATPTTDNTMGRNRIINGDMRIDARNAGASVTLGAASLFPVDRWKAHEDTDGAATAQQVSDAPAGFTNSLKLTVTGTDASLTGLQYSDVRQHIEGYNIADLSFGTAAAKDVTISFWVKSSVTGTYGGAISNGAFDRSYPFTYAISVADTWEYKTITIPGDTSGTWTTTNSTGMYLFFNLGSGPDYAGTAGQWNAAGDLAATGTTNLMATNGATFYITGVQLEAGSVATSFERRHYGQELALCHRYYQLIASGSPQAVCNATYYTSTALYGVLPLPVEMRAVPTVEQTTGTGYYAAYRNGAGDVFDSLNRSAAVTTNRAVEFSQTSGISGTGGHSAFIRTDNANSYLALSAEL
jgi:hypothetical protein